MISEELTIDGNVINYLSYRLSYDYEGEVWDIVGSHGGIIAQRKTLEQAVLFYKGNKRDWKELYYWAMVNANRRYWRKQNWAFITEHGVGSTKAREICIELGVDPDSIVFKREES